MKIKELSKTSFKKSGIRLRKLFNIEYDPKICFGEIHGSKEQDILAEIEDILNVDYNCFDDFVVDLIFHIKTETCCTT